MKHTQDAHGRDMTQGLSAEQLTLLLEVSRALSSSIDLPVVLQTAIERAVKAMELETGVIYLPYNDGFWLGASWPPLDVDFPDELRQISLADHPHISESFETQKPVYVEDARAVPMTAAERIAIEARDLRTLLYVPLIAEDEAIGCFIVGTSGHARPLKQADLDLCMTMSYIIAMAVENARLFESVRDANVKLSQAYEEMLERKAQLRALATQLTKTEERQRRKLAVEIHDRVTQPLALLKMKIFLNEEQWPAHHDHPEYRDAIQLLDEALDQTRSITTEMSPPYVFELGLRPALDWLCARMSSKGATCVATTHDSLDAIDEEPRLLAFQAARELLANVVKHAYAENATVNAFKEDDSVVLVVTDDGRGFDARRVGSRPSEDHGFGLFSLRERLTHAGGSLDVESTPGVGTTVTVKVPAKSRF